MTYVEAIQGIKTPGKRVAVIGAGGIGFDVAEWLMHDPSRHFERHFYNEWGIDVTGQYRGGVKPPDAVAHPREVYLLQRKKEKLGKRLGKTTGWIHRSSLNHRNVHMLSGVSYQRIDSNGLQVLIDGESRVLEVDSVIICTGQLELQSLFEPLKLRGKSVHLIGGAYKALELDARHAINQACRLAALL